MDRAAATTQPVILPAPPGSGKTFVAGLIHACSGLAEHPCVELDCAQQLAQMEGILSGIASGAVVSAGLHLGQRDRYRNQRIVIIQPSGGERYLSTAMWPGGETDVG